MYEKMFFLSGTPRSGSTLLSSLLSQNDNFYSGGHSSLCQIMWDTQYSCYGLSYNDMVANKRIDSIKNIISAIPKNYYFDVNKKIVFDKSSYWTHENNFSLIKQYIDNNPKIIVLVRNVKDILNSFIHIHIKNNSYYKDIEKYYLYENDLIINTAISGIQWAINNNKEKNFIFIKYEELCSFPERTMKKIYDFLNIEYFPTNFLNIENIYPEDDSVYKIKNLHLVRSTVAKEEKDFLVDKKYLKYCDSLNLKISKVL
jgi:sulfotransferase